MPAYGETCQPTMEVSVDGASCGIVGVQFQVSGNLIGPISPLASVTFLTSSGNFA